MSWIINNYSGVVSRDAMPRPKERGKRKMNHQTKVSPSMVIGIGPFGWGILERVSKLYFASDEARRRITKFVCLGQINETYKLDLLPIHEEDGKTPAKIQYPQSVSAAKRQEFIEALVRSADQIRASMNVSFHEIRTHEDLFQIELDQRLEKAINLFIVADLTDPMSAAALLPLTFLLQDITQHTDNAFGHLLLNTAIFPERDDLDDKDEVGLYAALIELDQAFTNVSGKGLQDLMAAMSIQNKVPLSFPAYLFDFRKPNDNDVRDLKELNIIFENSLIGLMLGDIPTTISRSRPLGYIQRKGLYYSSIGASCLVYEPEPLIENCSILFAQRLLNEGFLSKAYHDKGLLELTDQTLTRLGILPEWYGQLLAGTTHSMVILEDQTPAVVGNTTGLKLSPIDFENIKDTPWPTEIDEYSKKFINEVLPKTRIELGSRSTRFGSEQIVSIIGLLEEQIQNPTMYPQGPTAIKDLISSLEEAIVNFKADIEVRRKKLKPSPDEENITRDLNEIRNILKKAKDLPSFWVYIPRFLRKPFGFMFNLKWIVKNFIKLTLLKRKILLRLKQRNAILTELVVLDCIEQAFCEMNAKLNDFKAQVNAFESMIIDTAYLLQQLLTNGVESRRSQIVCDETFRVSAVDATFTQWAYEKYQKPASSLVVDLLTKEKIFERWMSLTAKEFKESVLGACKQLYHPLMGFHLEQVLATRLSLLREDVTHPMDVTFDPITPLLRTALPLMRPNFDAMGGSEYSTQRYFLLAENRDSQFIKSVLEKHNEVNYCCVDDPYIIAAVTIRDLMSLEAFTELNLYLRQAYEKLTSTQKERLRNVFVPMPKVEGEDLVEKTFAWRYGNPEETLEIVLPIGENRYNQARRETRLQQSDWDQYVLAESPEMNYLSACFLNIFLQHPQWSAYDQTSAILAFVQQGIEYAFDKDTTPEDDWPRYPIETLMEKVGDCEDAAILTAAIMSRLGFQVALLMLPGHCALGIAGVDNLPGTYIRDSNSGRHYYYAESTASGWQIGALPEKYQSADIEIVPVERLIS